MIPLNRERVGVMSRVEKAARNIKYGYIGLFVQISLGFVSRTIFIKTLGVNYLGINGLYLNVLGVLSLAELGMGSAMNYSLYKPVALGDIDKIKSILNLFKNAYRIIALIVSFLGLLLVPFLKFIVKDPGNISVTELTTFYLIFLFGTVSTYFVAYKYSIVNAEQKNYVQTNIQTITSLISISAQIIILTIYKDFLLYLLTGAIIGLIQKISINSHLNKLYPYLLDKKTLKLPKEERNIIKKNIKALIYHKFGEISVYQTDNIIISSFINITTVGLISNYNLIIASVSNFINILFGSLVSTIGNIIAIENKEKQYFHFMTYRFLGFWIYGFASIAFLILLNPFIRLWIGEKMLINESVIYLIIINYYIVGHRQVIANFASAAGIFNEVKYISIFQGIINLVISIIMVKLIGLEGVFIGTLISGLFVTFTKPIIVYRSIFNKNAFEYYKNSIIYVIAIVIAFTILKTIEYSLLNKTDILNFVAMMILVIIIPNLVFYVFFKNRHEFTYIVNLVKIKAKRN